VHDHVRGMTPWPGAFTHVGGKMIKMLATRRSTFSTGDAAPGAILVADPDAVLVACRDGRARNPARAGRGTQTAGRARAGRRTDAHRRNPLRLMSRSEDFIAEIRREFPRFRIVPKRDNFFSRVIDVLLKVLTFGAQRLFLTHYHTVIGNTLYVPDRWATTPDISRLITLRHERIHLRQRRRYGDIVMTLLYTSAFFSSRTRVRPSAHRVGGLPRDDARHAGPSRRR